MDGTELNFISLLRKFKVYIQGGMLLQMILVRNHIGDMLGGEQVNLHVETIGKDLGLQVKEFRFLYNIYWYIERVRTSRLLVLRL